MRRFELTYNTVAITTMSGGGAYYCFADSSSIDRDKYWPLSIMITYWAGAAASFTPYIQDGGTVLRIGFQSDISQTVNVISVRVVCMIL